VPGTPSGTFDECGGSQMISWEFTDLCGRTITHVHKITVDPAPEAAFINPPADTTIVCGDSLTLSIPDLFYSNNETAACEISGSVPGTPSGTFDECGGAQMITWEFTDLCGRTITYIQNITVDPAPPAAFINPPADTTISCGDSLTLSIPDLFYSNNETGACEISGSVPGTPSGTFDECGGSQMISWEFTDQCGRTITHVQTITVDPAPEAAFINPPADTTLVCGDSLTLSIPDLF
jgi:hypothetical protein